jgi:hypothetical protein
MVDPSGLEPLAFSVSRKRSDQTELRVHEVARRASIRSVLWLLCAKSFQNAHF